MIQLSPLKNKLEDRPTILRVYRSISQELNLSANQWGILCQKIESTYKELGGPECKKVNQKGIFSPSKYRFKIKVYPPEFIPVMVNIIKEYLSKNT